jgi:GH24 family phage-related lysozyme (muramidase)
MTPEQEVAFKALLVLREGQRTTVYRDSRGILTVGIGHRVVPADDLVFGQRISTAQMTVFFERDTKLAAAAADAQMADALITDPRFFACLASVNYQLGVEWTKEFPETWKLIMEGKYQEAANGLGNTKWDRETPARVADFQKALRLLPEA